MSEDALSAVPRALREGARAEDLEQEPLFDDRPALVMRAGHPLLSAADPAEATL